MLKTLCRLDNNLLSFLCGIFSNIPISLCFTFTATGKTGYEVWFFSTIVTAIIISVFLVVFSFMFTIRKIKYIQPVLDQEDGEPAKEKKLNEYLSDGIIMITKKRKPTQIKAKNYLLRPLVGFFICAFLLLATIIALWVLCNFI